MPKVRRGTLYAFRRKFYSSLAVPQFWKSVKIWQSYGEFKGGNICETQCIYFVANFLRYVSAKNSKSNNSRYEKGAIFFWNSVFCKLRRIHKLMTERWAQLLKFLLAAVARLVVRHSASGIIACRPGAHCGPPTLYIRSLPELHIGRRIYAEKSFATLVCWWWHYVMGLCVQFHTTFICVKIHVLSLCRRCIPTTRAYMMCPKS